MSAYVVGDSTITKLVDQMRMTQLAGRNHRNPSNPDFAALYKLDRAVDCVKLGRRLQDMNIAAVRERYPNGTETYEPYEYASNFPRSTSLVATYKALQCYLYQCSEGNVPDSDLFKQMEDWAHTLADHIVSHSAEYDKAPWG